MENNTTQKNTNMDLVLKVKKLLDRGFITREKDMVYLYKLHKGKMTSILENHL